MRAEEGIGLLAFLTALFTWGFMAYPAWCAFHLRDCALGRYTWQHRVSLAATALLGFVIIPASLFDVGWVLIPATLCLLAVDYITTQQVVLEVNETHGPCEPVRAFWGLFVPLLVLTVMSVGVVVFEYLAAVEESSLTISTLRNPALLSFVLLGVGPLVTAVVYLPLSDRKRRRMIMSQD